MKSNCLRMAFVIGLACFAHFGDVLANTFLLQSDGDGGEVILRYWDNPNNFLQPPTGEQGPAFLVFNPNVLANYLVQIEAVPNDRYSFSQWSGDTDGIADAGGRVQTFLMGADPRNISAVFEEDPGFGLALTILPRGYEGLQGVGLGRLETSVDGGITFVPYDPTTRYEEGDVVTIRATPEDVPNPNIGGDFASFVFEWTGDIPEGLGEGPHLNLTEFSVTMSADREISVLFSREYHPGEGVGDLDLDGLPDEWELRNELDPKDPTGVNGAGGNPSGDYMPGGWSPGAMNRFESGQYPADPADINTTWPYQFHNTEVRPNDYYVGVIPFNNWFQARGFDGWYGPNPVLGGVNDDPGTDPNLLSTAEDDEISDGWKYYFYGSAIHQSSTMFGTGLGPYTDPNNPPPTFQIPKEEIAALFGPELGIDPSADPDNDCASMLDEFLAGTDPFHWDTDADGISDGYEIRMGLEPLNPADAGRNYSGDYMAFYKDDDGNERRHHQVYADLGFDPRTGWGRDYYGRGPTRTRQTQPNTIPFSNLEKFKATIYLAAQAGGLDGEVLVFAARAGNVYAGGTFMNANGTAVSRIARWRKNAWQPLGGGLDGAVHALAIDSAGNVYAGGEFNNADDGAVPANHIAMWDGGGWSGLADDVDQGVDDVVRALAVNSNDELYVGGSFGMAGGVAAINIAVWDPAEAGNAGAWSALDDVNGAVHALVVDSNDDVYAGGFFTDAGNYVAHWDGAWNAMGLGLDGPVRALALDAADRLYVGGEFETADGVIQVANVARWDGAAWSQLDDGSGLLGVDGIVRALAVDDNDHLYVGGAFENAGAIEAAHIARWNDDDLEWLPLTDGTDARVNALAFDGGSLYVGGIFELAGVAEVQNTATYRGTWLPMGGRAMSCADFDLYALDPFSIDTDDDGIFDGWELYVAMNPKNDMDAFEDWDNDGLNNFQEFSAYDINLTRGTPWPNDREHFDPNWLNKVWPTDPHNRDTDGDGLSDGAEGGYQNVAAGIGNLGELKYSQGRAIWNGSCYVGGGLNPTSADTDGDMLPDHWEVRFRSTRYDIDNQGDRDGMDPTINDARRDYDEDGLMNYQEYLVGAVHHWRYRPDFPMISDGLPPGLPLGSHDPMYFFTGEPQHWDWHATRAGGNPYYYIEHINNRYSSTNPRLADTDRDGMDDYWKIYHGLNPTYGVIDLFVSMHANATVFAGTPLTSPIDVRLEPYAAGSPFADPDQDGLPNWAESLQPNDGPPYYYHTDPSPYWITDTSYERSWVNLYYAWNPMQPWYFSGAVLEGSRPPPTYMFSFAVNEGFDTDGDFIGDRAELVSDPVSPGYSDPLSVETPVRRGALYLEGQSAARTRAGFLHEYSKLNNFTIETWVRPENPASGQTQVIVERPLWVRSGNVMGWPAGVRLNFRLALDENGVPFVAYNGGGFDALYVEAKAPSQIALPANEWTHLAAVYDGADKQLRLYVNGELRRTVSSGERPYNGWTTGNPAFVSLGPVVIGAADENPRGWVSGMDILVGYFALLPPRTQPVLNHHFHGWVDEVRIWDGARTTGQLVENMMTAKSMRDVEMSLASGTELMYLYNFNNIHDPIVERVAPEGFDLLNGRPDDGSYPHVPWWATADDRSLVYDNYHYVPWIANMAARLPLDPPADSPFNRQVFQVEIETTEVVTNIVDLVDDEGEPTGDQILEVVTNVVMETETRINAFPNSANPYNMAYYHAPQGLQERNPDTMFHTDDSLVFTRRNANLFTDLLPLRQARADVTVDLWDGTGPGGPDTGSATDLNEDGIPDWWQRLHWPNFDPYAEGPNPWDPDADPDGDGLSNYWEYRLGSDPNSMYSLDPNGLISDADWDSDGDGISNIDEIMIYGTDPSLPDTDNDGWGDGMEVIRQQDPLDALNPLFPRALRVDGDPGSYVQMPDDPRFALDEFTFLAWVRPPAHDDLPDGENVEIIAREIGPNLFNYRLGWWWDPNVGAGEHRLAVEFNPSTGGSAVRAWTDEELEANEWSHVAGVFDKSRNVLELYIDGEVERAVDTTQRPQQRGTVQPVARVGRLLNGMIDDLVVYDQALTREQIHEIVGSDRATDPARGAMYDGLVLHYRFSSDKGALIPDLSGNRMDGTVSGGISWRGNEGVTFGSSLRFDGVNARLTVPDDYRLELFPVDDKTFSLWWRDSGGDGERPLLSRRTEHQHGFLLSIDMGDAPANDNDDNGDDNGDNGDDNGDNENDDNGNDNGEVRSGQYWLRTGPGWFNAEFTLEPDRYWNHLALVKEGGTWTIYHNGEELSVPMFISIPNANARAPLTIGWDPLLDRSFNGFMDEVRIYDRALSQEEIEQLQDESTLTAQPTVPWPVAYYVFDDGTNPDGTSGNPLWDFGQVQDFAGAYNQDWRHDWRNAGTLEGNAALASRETGVLWVTSPDPDGIYYEGDVVTLHVVFGEPVVVVDDADGTPRIELEMRDANRFADFIGNVAPNVLAFRYEVQAGDWAWHLDYASVNALTLEGGTIQDPAGNDLDLTLPVPGAVGSLSWAKNLLIDPPAENWIFSLAVQAGISEDWLILYFDGTGLRLDPYGDLHGKGMTLLEEYIAGTDPTDPHSKFQFLAPHVVPGPNDLELRWPAAAGREYTVEYATLDQLARDEPNWVQYGIKLDGFDGIKTVEVPFDSAGRVYRVRVRMKD